MFSFASKPQNVRSLIDQAFVLYKQAFAKVWYIAAIIMVIASIQRFSPLATNQSSGANGETAGIGIHMILVNFVTLVVMMLISAFFVTTIIHRIYSAATDSKASLNDSFMVAKNKILTVFAAMVIITIFVGAGFMLLVVPGFIIAMLLVFYLPNILFNNDGVLDAITNSFKLTWGWKKWWRTLGVLAPGIIVMIVVGPLLTLIMGKDNVYGIAAGDIIVGALVLPFFNAAILVQYNDLRLRSQQPGLGELKSD